MTPSPDPMSEARGGREVGSPKEIAMTPEQKIKWLILAKCAEWDGSPSPEFPASNVDALYDELVDRDEHWDATSEVRSSGIETGLKCDWSRHYESSAVAAQLPDGSWVGWTYWYGGGKHGEPGQVEWMSDAYELSCREEQKVMTVQTFERVATEAAP